MKKYTLLVLAMCLNIGLFGAESTSSKDKIADATRTFNTSILCYNPGRYQLDELEEKKLVRALQKSFETVQRLKPARCRELTQHPAFCDFIHKLIVAGKKSILLSLAHIIPENIDTFEKASVDVSASDEDDDLAAAIAASLAPVQTPTIIEASSLSDDDNNETFRFIPLSMLEGATNLTDVKWLTLK